MAVGRLDQIVTLTESAIRDICTEAVFERGENYQEEGRVGNVSRVDDTVAAVVRGTRQYDVTVDVAASGFDPQCSCPYDGPGACKHVVAVSLTLTDGLPADEGERVADVLQDVGVADLREFVREELTRDSELRERFFARFGKSPGKSVDEYREEVDQLFAQHTGEYPVVVEAIDFSRFTELAECHREQENHEQAATIYRALTVGIDENMDLVDAAYDHYARTFQSALDDYVECISQADIDAEKRREHVAFLWERATTGTDYLRDRYRAALQEFEE